MEEVETRGAAPRIFAAILDRGDRRVAWAVAGANLLLALFTRLGVLHEFANSADEYAYELSARLFARGLLSVPSPALPRFFDATHVVNDGRFYGKYPPGWPALLALGEGSGVPWIVNPLLGVGSVLLVHAIARRFVSARTANLACILLLANPFVVFQDASMFSHTSCLFFVLLASWFLFDQLEDAGRARPATAMGLCAGLAFTIRPWTALALLAVPAVVLVSGLRDPASRVRRAKALVLAALPFAACVAAMLAYNAALTGHALVTPFEKYNPADHLRLPLTAAAWGSRWNDEVAVRLVELSRWLVLSPLFAVAAMALPETRGVRALRLLAGCSLSLLVAFFFYPVEGGLRYGPRYLYESAGFLVIVAAAVLATRRTSIAIGGAIAMLALNVIGFGNAARATSAQVWRKQDLARQVDDAKLSGALVFLKTGSGGTPARDSTRNDLDFEGSVLYVLDRGDENRRLLRLHPRRSAWTYEFDRRAGRGVLRPLPDRAEEGPGPVR